MVEMASWIRPHIRCTTLFNKIEASMRIGTITTISVRRVIQRVSRAFSLLPALQHQLQLLLHLDTPSLTALLLHRCPCRFSTHPTWTIIREPGSISGISMEFLTLLRFSHPVIQHRCLKIISSSPLLWRVLRVRRLIRLAHLHYRGYLLSEIHHNASALLVHYHCSGSSSQTLRSIAGLQAQTTRSAPTTQQSNKLSLKMSKSYKISTKLCSVHALRTAILSLSLPSPSSRF